MSEWSIVITLDGMKPNGEREKIPLAQCPQCSALVWDVNKGYHDTWHEETAGRA